MVYYSSYCLKKVCDGRSFFGILVLACFIFFSQEAEANGQREGVAYVASLRGSAQSSVTSKAIQRGDILSCQENHISLGADSFVVLMLSNGITLYCGENAQLSLKQFTQFPFNEEGDNLTNEPSRSTTQIKLLEGEFGFSHRIPYATSIYEIETPYGMIEPLTQSFAIALKPAEAQLFVFKGSAKVELKARRGKDLVQLDQMMDLRAGSSMLTTKAIKRINRKDELYYKNLSTMADNMTQRVRFIEGPQDELSAKILFTHEHFKQSPLNGHSIRNEQ